MGNNYYTKWISKAVGVTGTKFTVAAMDPALAGLDRACTYFKGAFVGCDGTLSWSAGTLTWSGALHIYFTTSAGLECHNSVAAGNIALSDSEYAYVTLSETNDTEITVSKAAFSLGSASGFMPYNRLCLGYRNAGDDGFYPEELAGVFTQQVASGSFIQNSALDAQSILAAVSDNTPVAVTVAEQRIVGRKTGGNIDDLTGAEVLAIANGMQAGQQQITCADNVTIDWSAGSTGYMTFDRDSVALTFSNPVAGQVYRLMAKQSAGGSDVFTYATTIKWRGGSAPTLTTTGNSVDIFTFVYIDSVWYGDCALNFA